MPNESFLMPVELRIGIRPRERNLRNVALPNAVNETFQPRQRPCREIPDLPVLREALSNAVGAFGIAGSRKKDVGECFAHGFKD